jgi:hypothetical protein
LPPIGRRSGFFQDLGRHDTAATVRVKEAAPDCEVFAAAATQMAIPHRVALREIRGGLTVAARASEVGEFTPLSGVVALLASREKQECTVKPLLSMQSG